MTPNLKQLQDLSQKRNESFKGYPQQWRELVAQVQLPLLEKEMVDLFMDTLQSPYFRMMIGNASSNFYDQVKVGECIESSLKSEKIQGTSSSQTGENESFSDSQEEEEDETDAIMETHQALQVPSPMPYCQYPYVMDLPLQ